MTGAKKGNSDIACIAAKLLVTAGREVEETEEKNVLGSGKVCL